jgi:hypothetical protein
MSDPYYPVFASTPVLPEPTKVNFVAASMTIGVQRMVGLQVSTPTGVQFYFLDPDAATELAKSISRVAAGIAPA